MVIVVNIKGTNINISYLSNHTHTVKIMNSVYNYVHPKLLTFLHNFHFIREYF